MAKAELKTCVKFIPDSAIQFEGWPRKCALG